MNISEIADRLRQQQVVAYPTEAVFGLGCNPHRESAVRKLLELKQRSVDKGLILVAPSLVYLLPFIDVSKINQKQYDCLADQYERPTTWLVPAKKDTPTWLTGKFESIAVRLCRHPAVVELCHLTNFALTSTSANLSGQEPCKTADEVRSQFGENFPVLDDVVGEAEKPSEIRDLFTGQIFR